MMGEKRAKLYDLSDVTPEYSDFDPSYVEMIGVRISYKGKTTRLAMDPRIAKDVEGHFEHTHSIGQQILTEMCKLIPEEEE